MAYDLSLSALGIPLDRYQSLAALDARYVPFTGASADVDLGTHTLKSGSIGINIAPDAGHQLNFSGVGVAHASAQFNYPDHASQGYAQFNFWDKTNSKDRWSFGATSSLYNDGTLIGNKFWIYQGTNAAGVAVNRYPLIIDDSGNVTLSGTLGAGAITSTGALIESSNDGIGNLTTPPTDNVYNGLLLSNDTAVGSATRQTPPYVIFRGHGWTGSADQITEHAILSDPTTNGNPTFRILMREGGSGGWTNVWNVDAQGQHEADETWTDYDARETFTLRCGYTNSAAATASYDQYSVSHLFSGRGWKTNATAGSQSMSLRYGLCPEQGAANPIGVFKYMYGTNTTSPAEANELYRLEWGDRLGFVFNKQALANYTVDIPTDTTLLRFGAGNDSSIGFDGNSLNIVANAVTGTDTLNLTAASILTSGDVYLASAVGEQVGFGLTSLSPTYKFHFYNSSINDFTRTVLFEAKTSATNTVISPMTLKITSTGDMVDGHGGGFLFAIEDVTGAENFLGRVACSRNGGDTIGKLTFDISNSGSLNSTPLTLTPTTGLLNCQVGIGVGFDGALLNIEGSLSGARGSGYIRALRFLPTLTTQAATSFVGALFAPYVNGAFTQSTSIALAVSNVVLQNSAIVTTETGLGIGTASSASVTNFMGIKLGAGADASGKYSIYDTSALPWALMTDSQKIWFGAGLEYSIYNDGANFILNRESGAGHVQIKTTSTDLHNLKIMYYGSSTTDNTAGISFGVGVNQKSAIVHQRKGSYGVGDLVFLVDSTADGADAAITDEKMRIQGSTGNVSIVGQHASTRTTKTLAAAATALAVTSNTVTVTGDAGGNTVATITGGISGQLLTLIFVDALVVVTDTAATTANTVNLSAAFTSAANTTLTLVNDGNKWFEVARSVNG